MKVCDPPFKKGGGHYQIFTHLPSLTARKGRTPATMNQGQETRDDEENTEKNRQ